MKFKGMKLASSLIALGFLMASGSVFPQGITSMKQGAGGSVIQGAAGTNGSEGDKGLQHCDSPLGAIAVVEPQDSMSAALARFSLSSPVGIIRMMIQQSNCFLVVERGQGMQNMMQERALAGGSELRQGSNVGGGQMVAADFILTPSVVFSEGNAKGGGLGAIGGLFGPIGLVAGAIAGGLKFKEAQTSMLVADARTGIQIASAEGSARKADMSLGGFLAGGGGALGAGGYSNTNEGKVIAASLVDNFNNIVNVVRNDPNLKRSVGTLAAEAGKGGTTQAGTVFKEGDVVQPKISNVQLLAKPSDGSTVVMTMPKGTELIYMGKEENGFLNVESSKGNGWVKKVFVAK